VAAFATGEACLALPKLNLQFLTFHDYLLRNFNLFRLEATYEVQTIAHLHSWARYASNSVVLCTLPE
jgi:Intron-binding protein aquarius N-terminus